MSPYAATPQESWPSIGQYLADIRTLPGGWEPSLDRGAAQSPASLDDDETSPYPEQ